MKAFGYASDRISEATERAVNAGGAITRGAARKLAAEVRRELAGVEFPRSEAIAGFTMALLWYKVDHDFRPITMRASARETILAAIASKAPEAVADIRTAMQQLVHIIDFKV